MATIRDLGIPTGWRMSALALVGALALTACGSDGDDEPGGTAEEQPDATDEQPSDPDDAGEDGADGADGEDAGDDPGGTDGAEDSGGMDAGGPELAVASTGLGEVLVDGDGLTLYVFDPDEQGESTCYDTCAENWPPVTGGEPVVGDGVDESLVGTVERDDGETQATYDGWPLYRFYSDEEPGDVNGQGLQDVWWVVDPAGEPLRDAEAAAAPSGPSY